MIGLKLPRLFYGRKRRQTVVGVRADFCEFCVVVSRHWIVSLQTSPTFFFVPFNYEETDRETECEICHCRFPASLDLRFRKGDFHARLDTDLPAITELIQETNPGIVDRALIELDQMRKRTALSASDARKGNLLQKNRIINFLRRHELELHEQTRTFLPFVAIGSIQAAIIGLALSTRVPLWLSLSFAACLLALASLVFLLVVRRRIHRLLGRSTLRLLGVTGDQPEVLAAQIMQLKSRFPRSSRVLLRQLAANPGGSPESFLPDRDYISLLDQLDVIPEL